MHLYQFRYKFFISFYHLYQFQSYIFSFFLHFFLFSIRVICLFLLFFTVFYIFFCFFRGLRPPSGSAPYMLLTLLPKVLFYSLSFLLFFYYFTHYEFISFKKLGNNTNSTFLQDNYKQILRNLNIKSNTLVNFKSTFILENENWTYFLSLYEILGI